MNATSPVPADQPGAPTRETIEVVGLERPAEIIVDRWGIPHIRAGSRRDLFLVQGFNAARDRLWQIDLWRKRGLGILAKDFGPGFLMQDRAARLFLYRGDMEAEWAAYGVPDMREICEAFAAGINAYIALVEREPERLPEEFTRLGNRPSPWAAEDVVRIRTHGLMRNGLSEALRAAVIHEAGSIEAGLAADAFRMPIDPPMPVEPAPGLDLGALPLSCTEVFRLATAAVSFSPDRLAARPDEAEQWSRLNDLGEVMRDLGATGSNNWAIHGSRTASGRPILASDPHRVFTMPSIRYLVHLSAPGIDVIGAGEASSPGIVIGHNDAIAFGLTIFGGDLEDVYVYETKPGEPDLYRYGDGWERMRVVEERFEVAGSEARTFALRFTRHGPVMHQDPDRGTAVALRSAWFEPGSGAYLASLGSMTASSIEFFQAQMRNWGTPSVNQVVAETSGRIAWMPVGRHPDRPNWNGTLPVPGDGRFEWNGFLDPDLLPRIVDPLEGFVATANEMNLPAGWDHDRHTVGSEWSERSRASRLREVLSATDRHDVATSRALQTDTLSVPARRIGALLGALERTGPHAAALDLLAGWDHHLDSDSAAAALFEVWYGRHLKPALLRRVVPEDAVRRLLVPIENEPVLAVLEDPAGSLGSVRERDTLLTETLAAADAECVALMGTDRAAWAWGRLHHQLFEHPLASIGPREVTARFDVGPYARGGSGSTTMFASYRPGDFRVTNGASVRLVMDVGAWDESVCINTPGQSGEPRSPFYANLGPVWAAGDYVPLLYTGERIDRAAILRIELVPGGPA